MEARTVSVRDGMFSATVSHGGGMLPDGSESHPLLFLHGSGGLHETGYLDDLTASFSVYAPAHPGFGDSTGIEHIDDIIDLALYYHDLMDELEIESAHVVGHSLGGLLAAELAALCPHRVRRLVLANPVGLWRDEEPVLDFFTLSPQELLPYMVHDMQSAAVQEAYAPAETPEAQMEAMYQRLQSYSAAGKFLWPIPDKGLKRRIHRVQSPTLIVWGESDRLVAPSYAEDFRTSIRDSRAVIMRECGHLPMIEKRDEFVRLVTDFLLAADS